MSKRFLKKKTYYHIYNRGCNKQRLFFCEKDFGRYWNTIERYLIEFPHIRIHVWCVLPNHFHFLLSEEGSEESGLKSGLEKSVREVKSGLESAAADQISDFMRKIQQSYAMYFNAKYADSIKQGRKAPVFEGNFKAKEITDEDYLASVAYYVRNNAVKHDIVDSVEDWPWAGSTESEDFPAMDYIGIDAEFDPGFE